MSDLRFNTIAGTVLGSLLLVMGLREASTFVFHPEIKKESAYAVDIAVAQKAAGPAEEDKAIDWGRLFADQAQLTQLVADGDKVHKQCLSCHSDQADGTGSKTGPKLYGVFGRTAGTEASYASYSAPMRAYAKPWSYDNLYDYLKAPGQYVKGTSMTFAGVRRSSDRVALVAYLRSLGGGSTPLPAPLPEAAPAEAAAPAPAPAEGAAPAEPTAG